MKKKIKKFDFIKMSFFHLIKIMGYISKKKLFLKINLFFIEIREFLINMADFFYYLFDQQNCIIIYIIIYILLLFVFFFI